MVHVPRGDLRGDVAPTGSEGPGEAGCRGGRQSVCVRLCVCVDRGEGAFRHRLGGKKEPGMLVPGTELSSRDWPGGCEGRMVRKDPDERNQGLVSQRRVCHPGTVESTEGISRAVTRSHWLLSRESTGRGETGCRKMSRETLYTSR